MSRDGAPGVIALVLALVFAPAVGVVAAGAGTTGAAGTVSADAASVADADPAVSVSAPATAEPGETIEISYTVRNAADDDRSLLLYDGLPEVWTVEDADAPTGNGFYTDLAGAWLWIDRFEPGATDTVNATVRVPDDADGAVTVTPTVRAESGATVDATATVTVESDESGDGGEAGDGRDSDDSGGDDGRDSDDSGGDDGRDSDDSGGDDGQDSDDSDDGREGGDLDDGSVTVSAPTEATAGGTVEITYTVTNTVDDERGLLLYDGLPDGWAVESTRGVTGNGFYADGSWLWVDRFEVGDSDTVTATVRVPDDASGAVAITPTVRDETGATADAVATVAVEPGDGGPDDAPGDGGGADDGSDGGGDDSSDGSDGGGDDGSDGDGDDSGDSDDDSDDGDEGDDGSDDGSETSDTRLSIDVPAEATAGGTVEAAYTVANTADDDRGILLYDGLPDDWTVEAAERPDNGDGFYSGEAGAWLWIDRFEPGETRTLNLTVRVPEDASGTVELTPTARDDDGATVDAVASVGVVAGSGSDEGEGSDDGSDEGDGSDDGDDDGSDGGGEDDDGDGSDGGGEDNDGDGSDDSDDSGESDDGDDSDGGEDDSDDGSGAADGRITVAAPAEATAGGTVEVRYVVENVADGDSALLLYDGLPDGWTVEGTERPDSGDGFYSGEAGAWLWVDRFEPDETRTLNLTVRVPGDASGTVELTPRVRDETGTTADAVATVDVGAESDPGDGGDGGEDGSGEGDDGSDDGDGEDDGDGPGDGGADDGSSEDGSDGDDGDGSDDGSGEDSDDSDDSDATGQLSVVAPAEATAGGTVEIGYTVTNTADGDSALLLYDGLPDDWTVEGTERPDSGDGFHSEEAGAWLWVDRFEPGETRTLNLTVRIPDSVVGTTELTPRIRDETGTTADAVATVAIESGDGSDPGDGTDPGDGDDGDGSDDGDSPGETSDWLAVTVPAEATAGGTVEIGYTVTNAADGDRGILLYDGLPDGWTVEGTERPDSGDGFHSDTAGAWMWIDRFEPDETRTLNLTVRVPGNASGAVDLVPRVREGSGGTASVTRTLTVRQGDGDEESPGDGGDSGDGSDGADSGDGGDSGGSDGDDGSDDSDGSNDSGDSSDDDSDDDDSSNDSGDSSDDDSSNDSGGSSDDDSNDSGDSSSDGDSNDGDSDDDSSSDSGDGSSDGFDDGPNEGDVGGGGDGDDAGTDPTPTMTAIEMPATTDGSSPPAGQGSAGSLGAAGLGVVLFVVVALILVAAAVVWS